MPFVIRSRVWSFLLLPVLWNCAGTRPSNLGLSDGQLSPCPPTPNCVSSQATDREHKIEALTTQGADGITSLASIVKTLPRSEIVKQSEDYLHVEFTSLLLRFVDDVEFYLPEGRGVIEVRSASRLGRSDLGVNRKRVEQIRQLYKESKLK